MDIFKSASNMIIEIQNKNAELELDKAALQSMVSKLETEKKDLYRFKLIVNEIVMSVTYYQSDIEMRPFLQKVDNILKKCNVNQ